MIILNQLNNKLSITIGGVQSFHPFTFDAFENNVRIKSDGFSEVLDFIYSYFVDGDNDNTPFDSLTDLVNLLSDYCNISDKTALVTPLNSTIQPGADALIVRQSDTKLDVSRGLIIGQTRFGKFGRNEAVKTTPEPVSIGGVYQTPTALTSLEILSSSASDTVAGVGARTVLVRGISTNYEEIEETVNMNGTTAVALANQFYRVYSALVVTSGTYAGTTASSHVGNITIRTAGAGATWATISVIGLARGRSQIANYTVPAGKTLYLDGFDITVQTTKIVSVMLFKREQIDVVSAPFDTMQLVREYTSIGGFIHVNLDVPLSFPEKTDIGFMAYTSAGTSSLSIQMDGVLINN